MASDGGIQLALVLGAGGIRGIAHIGVLQGLAERGLRPQALVGVSSGALVAAVHAALGWDAGRLADSASRFGPVAALGLALRRPWLARIPRLAGRGPGEMEAMLDLLSGASFEDLHHGVSRLGILCLDRLSGRERFFVTGDSRGRPPLAQAVVGSMTLPLLFPAQVATVDGVRMALIDGGIRRTLPLELALQPPIAARRVLAVDLGVMTGDRERGLERQAALQANRSSRVKVIRPALGRFGILLMKRGDPRRLLEAGHAAVTTSVASWCMEP